MSEQKKPMDDITCLYCFKHFSHDQVHFRIRTVFAPEQFDDPAPGEQRFYSMDELKSAMLPAKELQRRSEIFQMRQAMSERDDEKYMTFWNQMGGTTENDTITVGSKEHSRCIQAYQLPVFDPGDPKQKRFFEPHPLRRNANGFVYGAVDAEHTETTFRVCPYCHNPLPGIYGYYPVRFISVIGITGAGKTVYLSQLCKYIQDQFAQYGVSVTPTSAYANKYMKDNPVTMGTPLPAGTAPETLLQPLCFDVTYSTDNGGKMTQTLVFYDIAGENCMVGSDGVLGAGAMRFGPFINHSDGIMLVIPPEQITKHAAVGPQESLTVIKTLFGASPRGVEALNTLPMAVCISQGDKVERQILGGPMRDLARVDGPVNGRSLPVFNATDYNALYEALDRFVDAHAASLSTAMRADYHCSDYFLFSAIGTDVVRKSDAETGGTFYTPAAPVSPKRLVEPLLWMLTKFQYIGANGFIDEINDWFCLKCRRRLHTPEAGGSPICPDCRLDRAGDWRCPECGAVHPDADEWCENKASGRKKCNTNRFGEHKKRFGLF